MNRIDEKFNKLKKINKKAFIAYLTAGDPSIEKTEQLVYALEEGGADIIEIGIPFSDPLADGHVIQEAALRAFKNGITLKKIFTCVQNIRKNTDIPFLFLVYYNTIYSYGITKFVQKCDEIGIDGLIIPDLPLEERCEVLEFTSKYNIALIPLVAINSKNRIEDVISNCSGFVYCVSSLGVTGVRKEFDSRVENFLKEVKEQSNIPIAVGFGISSKETVKYFKQYVDGVIVGSAIVKVIEKTNGDYEAVKNIVKTMQQ